MHLFWFLFRLTSLEGFLNKLRNLFVVKFAEVRFSTFYDLYGQETMYPFFFYVRIQRFHFHNNLIHESKNYFRQLPSTNSVDFRKIPKTKISSLNE